MLPVITQLVKWLVMRKRIVLVEVQCRVTSLLRQIVSVVARCTLLIVALARLCPTGHVCVFLRSTESVTGGRYSVTPSHFACSGQICLV